MTDLEITRRCAEAMGWQHVRISTLAIPGHPMGDPPYVVGSMTGTSVDEVYDPLHDDAQAMALVNRFGLSIELSGLSGHWPFSGVTYKWIVRAPHQHPDVFKYEAVNENLNRAICECVAKMSK